MSVNLSSVIIAVSKSVEEAKTEIEKGSKVVDLDEVEVDLNVKLGSNINDLVDGSFKEIKPLRVFQLERLSKLESKETIYTKSELKSLTEKFSDDLSEVTLRLVFSFK
ncbi:MAG: hypothetical protein MUC81_09270 [Bacteroidia bacterium]|jgi:hypothetical protein|nr:hypothetical protein [Bacteroidia bacterium]